MLNCIVYFDVNICRYGRLDGTTLFPQGRLDPTMTPFGWHLKTLTLMSPNSIFNPNRLSTIDDLNLINQLLRDRHAGPWTGNHEGLYWSCLLGHSHLLNLFLKDENIDPVAGDNEVLRLASRFGHLNVVNGLLEDMRVDPSAEPIRLAFKTAM